MKTRISSLVKLGACHDALAWCRKNSMPNLETAWLTCPRGDWLEWLASKLNANPAKLADYWAKRAPLDAEVLAYIRSAMPDCAWNGQKLEGT